MTDLNDVLVATVNSGSALIATAKIAKLGEEFLRVLFLPAAKSVGQALDETVKSWSAARFRQIAGKSATTIASLGRDPNAQRADGRLVHSILAQGSWAEADELQDIYAGLLTSSCHESAPNDDNIIFVDLLARMSLLEVRLFNFACKNCVKAVTPVGLVSPGQVLRMRLSTLIDVMHEPDIHSLDRQIDHLRSLMLLQGAIALEDNLVDLTPTPLALQMYMICSGTCSDPIEFYNLSDSPRIAYSLSSANAVTFPRSSGPTYPPQSPST